MPSCPDARPPTAASEELMGLPAVSSGGDAERHRTGCLGYLLVGLLAIALSWLAGWLGTRLWATASSDCGVDLDSSWELSFSGEFLIGGFVASAVVLVLALLATRVHPALGLLVVLALTAVTLYVQMNVWGFGRTSKAVFDQGSVQSCPSGVPQWWPWWAPH
jgi:hypothetical protein